MLEDSVEIYIYAPLPYLGASLTLILLSSFLLDINSIRKSRKEDVFTYLKGGVLGEELRALSSTFQMHEGKAHRNMRAHGLMNLDIFVHVQYSFCSSANFQYELFHTRSQETTLVLVSSSIKLEIH